MMWPLLFLVLPLAYVVLFLFRNVRHWETLAQVAGSRADAMDRLAAGLTKRLGAGAVSQRVDTVVARAATELYPSVDPSVPMAGSSVLSRLVEAHVEGPQLIVRARASAIPVRGSRPYLNVHELRELVLDACLTPDGAPASMAGNPPTAGMQTETSEP